MKAWPYVLIALMVPLADCGGKRDRISEPAPTTQSWRDVATPADRERIRGWRDSWIAATAKVVAAGQGRALAVQGALMQPDGALADPAPPPGDYRCRTTKLGSQGPAGLDYVAYPAFNCRVVLEKDMLSFTKLDGSQRPVGLLFPDDGGRLIFLGTMMLADEQRALDYGRDPERDMAGVLERIGPARWRLVFPRPRWESMLDVIELVPKN